MNIKTFSYLHQNQQLAGGDEDMTYHKKNLNALYIISLILCIQPFNKEDNIHLCITIGGGN